jgi:SAM-dependent methyltransferase
MLSLERQNEWRERYRAERPGWRPATELFAARVRAALPPGGRWLDLGCGRGGLVEQLTHPPALTFGIDPDLASLREHRLPALARAVSVSNDLPFGDKAFDVVTAAWLLEHLSDPPATFAAVVRVLRPGGAFVFITPNARHPLGWANRLAGRLGRLQGRLVDLIYGRAEEDTFPTAYRANSPQTLRHLTATAGLELEALDCVADPSYLAVNQAAFRAMSFIDDRLPADRHIHLVGVARK